MNIVKSTIFQIIRRKESLLFLVIFIAGLSLFGWLNAKIGLASYSLNFIPIAPSSIAMFLTLSILLLIKIKYNKSEFLRSIVEFFIIINAIYCSIILLEYLFNFSWNIEYILIKNPEKFGSVFVGRMSPITALLFIFICISLLSNRQKSSNIIKYAGGICSLFVFLISSVLLIGYLYKAPLLYGSQIIPVSLPAAICFSLFSITLLRIYELKFWTFNLIKDNKFSLLLLKSFLPIVVIAVILQGLSDANFPFNDNNPTLSVAFVLFIFIIMVVYTVIKVSTTLGDKLLRAEKATKESEIKYQNLVDNLGEGIGIVDINEVFVFVNPAAERIFGVGEEKLLGKNLKDFLSEELYVDILHQTKIRKNLQSSSYETELTLLDGKKRHIQITAVPNLDIDEKITGTLAVFRDITERNKFEKALQENEEKLRSILENSADAIFITNQNGQYVYTNNASSVMLGYSSEEMISKTLADISPPDKIEEYFEFFKQIICEGKGFAEIELLKKNGNYISTDLNAVLLPNGQVFGSCRDITKRKEAEKVLRESESALRDAQVIGKIGSWEWDLVTQKTIWSDNNFAILGLNSTEVEASFKLFRSRIHPDDFHIIDEAHLKLMKDKTPVNFELRLIDPDGTIKWIQNDISLVIEDDKPIKLKGVIIDITNLKKTELKIKESEKQLLRLNEDKDRFISILGHDLKSPFNNILGFSEVLTEEFHNLNKAEIEDIVKNINKSARITNKLLEDILLWARAQQGNITFNPQNLSLSAICKSILEVLNPGAHAKNITIYDSYTTQINVYADADMLKTMLLNLVSNSIKFTNRGGKITISAEQNSENVTISVSDNGIGIINENLAKLFDLSEVLTTKGTAGETGTGLGLLLCKEFAEKHQGKIWVESVVDKGSEFKFTLPVS